MRSSVTALHIGPMSVASSSGSPICKQAGALDQQVDEAIVDVAVHEHALGGRADLPGQVEAAHHRGVRRGLEVGVGEHDLRAVAAQLEDAVLEPGLARDLLAGRDRAR